MKNFFLIISSMLISSQLLAAPFCGLAYQNKSKELMSQDLKELKSLNRLDDLTNFIRKYKVKNSDTFSYIEKIKIKHNMIDTEVVSWNVDSAIRKWRPLFRKVEGSSLYIEKYQKVLTLLDEVPEARITQKLLTEKKVIKPIQEEILLAKEKMGLLKYKKAIEKNLKKETRRLGNHFYEYRYVKAHLEGLEKLHCNPDCLAQLERLKREVGITSAGEREYFSSLVQNRKELKLAFVEKVFQENIYAFTTAQRLELFHETASFLGSYAREIDLMWTVMKKLSDKSWVQNRSIARLFKAIYDKKARIVNDPLINQIVRVHSDAEMTVSRLKGKLKSSKDESLLVDFSRREDALAQRSWKETKDFAAKNDKAFYDKMQKAEKVASFLGEAKGHLPRGFYYALAAAAVGGGLILYADFETGPAPAPVIPPVTPSGTSEEDDPKLLGLVLPLYPDENDTTETVILGEKDYSAMMKMLENNADVLDSLPSR